MVTRLHTDTMTDTMTCGVCRKDYSIAGTGPVTVDGWYGNVRVQWGRVGGVHTSRFVRVRCPICGHEQPGPGPWPFD